MDSLLNLRNQEFWNFGYSKCLFRATDRRIFQVFFVHKTIIILESINLCVYAAIQASTLPSISSN